ncbi:MAG TPA: hypothetical protein P5093_15475, partial [Ottowia sp.]|uniref:hypothetical protein n=1 Tax=Ottowia sp. TaxID=1898956 RepID=UPI002C1C4A47
ASQAARSEAKGHGQWGRLFFAYFLLAKQKKVGAPPGAHPGLQRHQKHSVFNSCLRPPRLGKAPISFKKPSVVHKCGHAHAQPRAASKGIGGRKPTAGAQGFDEPALSLPKGSARTADNPHAGPGRFE